ASSGDGYRFTGSIDRVDTDGEGNYVVIDYKSSGGSLKNYDKWIENDDFQLAVYSQALESGLSDLPKGKVISAVYYVARDLSRTKGFRLRSAPETLFTNQDRTKGKLTEEELSQLYEEVNQAVGEAVSNISQGIF